MKVRNVPAAIWLVLFATLFIVAAVLSFRFVTQLLGGTSNDLEPTPSLTPPIIKEELVPTAESTIPLITPTDEGATKTSSIVATPQETPSIANRLFELAVPDIDDNLWLIDIDSGPAKAFPSFSSWPYDSKWSPDGGWIAIRTLSAQPQMWLVDNADGEAWQVLPELNGRYEQLYWSHTGRFLAFELLPYAPKNSADDIGMGLHILDTATRTYHVVTGTEVYDCGIRGVEWSFDDEWLVAIGAKCLSGSAPTEQYELVSFRLDGSEMDVLWSSTELMPSVLVSSPIEYRMAVYLFDSLVSRMSGPFTISFGPDAVSEGLRPVLNNGAYYSPSHWSEDGNHLYAFGSDGIYILDTDSATVDLIWKWTGNRAGYLSLSPSNRRLYLSRCSTCDWGPPLLLDLSSGSSVEWWGQNILDVCAAFWGSDDNISAVAVCKIVESLGVEEISIVHEDGREVVLDIFSTCCLEASPIHVSERVSALVPTTTITPSLGEGTAVSTEDNVPMSPVSTEEWTKAESSITSTLYSLKALSPTDAWAVGSYGTILRWDGNAWSEAPSPTSETLYSVDMISANDGWAVGSFGTILHWDGSTWSMVPAPTQEDLSSISMISTTDGWAVGGHSSGRGYAENRQIILRWDGLGWHVFHDTNGSRLNDVTMLTSSDGWAVGHNGTMLQWDGTQWDEIFSPITNRNLYGVDLVAHDAGWVVGHDGYGGNSMILYWNGSAWSQVDSPILSGLTGVNMLSGDEGWAVGYNGTILHWNGHSWTTVNTPGGLSWLGSVNIIPDERGWAVGHNGTILSYETASASQLPPSEESALEESDTLQQDQQGAPAEDRDLVDRGSPDSVIRLLVSGLNEGDLTAIDQLILGETIEFGTGMSVGNEEIGRSQFLEMLGPRLASAPVCEGYVGDENSLQVITSGWSPDWESNGFQAGGVLAFGLVNINGEFFLSNAYFTPSPAILAIGGNPCPVP